MLTARRCQAVHHQIHLAQIGFDQFDGFFLYRIGKRIAVDVLLIEAGFFRRILEGHRVVPAGGAGAFAGSSVKVE